MIADRTEPTSAAAGGSTTESLTGQRQEIVVIEIGGAQFGISVTMVTEVSPVPRITRLPFPPVAIAGVVSLRNEILPVLDMGQRLFGLPSSRDGKLVIVTDPAHHSRIGLLVDRVVDLIAQYTVLDDPPEELTASLPDGWIESIVSTPDERLIAMLDLAAIVDRTDSADEEDQ